MRDERSDITAEYSSALRAFFAGGEEEALMRGGMLGRRAMTAGLGVLELVVMHHRAVWAALAGSPGDEVQRKVDAASVFLCETLSPFEITHKGFREATDVTNRLLWLASVLSHELKTPLTGVLNSAGMLKDVLGAAEGSLERRLLENVLQSANILKARTDELTDLVGLHTGSLPLRVASVDPAATVRSVVERMGPVVQAAGMELAAEVQEGGPLILADGGRLEQVLANLIENAVKYGSDGKRIEVRVYRRDSDMVFEVQDYGAGISLWDRMSLFQPYFRGERGGDEVPGAGLGLALCKQLVQLHHGSISVETEPGRGSLFRVVLPLSQVMAGG